MAGGRGTLGKVKELVQWPGERLVVWIRQVGVGTKESLQVNRLAR